MSKITESAKLLPPEDLSGDRKPMKMSDEEIMNIHVEGQRVIKMLERSAKRRRSENASL